MHSLKYNFRAFSILPRVSSAWSTMYTLVINTFCVFSSVRKWGCGPPFLPWGSSSSLDWLKPTEQKYPHACVFSAAWGNVIMLRLIRLTLTIPQGKSLHICNRQIITLPQMFISFFFCVFVLFLLCLWKTISDFWFFFSVSNGHRFSVFLGLCGKHGWKPSSLSQGQALPDVSVLGWISLFLSCAEDGSKVTFLFAVNLVSTIMAKAVHEFFSLMRQICTIFRNNCGHSRTNRDIKQWL